MTSKKSNNHDGMMQFFKKNMNEKCQFMQSHNKTMHKIEKKWLKGMKRNRAIK